MAGKGLPIPAARIENRIFVLRGHKVMLSGDIALLYGVESRVLAQAVKRNLDRFPYDFMFRLTWQELDLLKSQSVILDTEDAPASRSQNVILKRGRNVKHLPYAFTEQGVSMLSSVLRSKRAVRVNVEIMRAFVRLRQLLASHADLARRLNELERKYDAQFKVVFDAIRELMEPPPEDPPKGRIGFHRSPMERAACSLKKWQVRPGSSTG